MGILSAPNKNKKQLKKLVIMREDRQAMQKPIEMIEWEEK